ncbi:MAG TPA: GGDEF domain-containing protein [Mycobacteriales bacterium]|nr:GGDEF domain-containing protein [Mycobacteriales bacterium]
MTHPAHMDVPWGRYPGRLLRVYVPLRLSDAPTAIAGVAELHFPYEPLAADITADTRQIMWWMLAGLTVLYLGLFRVVARASAQLRVQSRTNERLALHDALTGLPNRVLLKDRTTQALAAATRSGARVGLLLLDLDRFKEINDTLGHHCGDDLLVQVGPRLRGVLREADTIARLGGDEFVVLLPDLATEADAFAVADKLLAGLHEPFVLDGVTLDVEASMGVTVAPEHGDSFEVLLQRADIAMYVAKETHTGSRRTRRSWTATAPRGCRCWVTCAAGWTGTNSCCTTSRRRSWRPDGCSRSRRWPVGSTRSAGCWVPGTSSRWPSAPG